ncbi:hypothetical protein [Streptomyces sp. NPDC005407]|uniref:hypothetical protein n=1 Tax=Streptomyces sp. NPDC005407 TaxID=3155340 RepID=UPI0033BCE124
MRLPYSAVYGVPGAVQTTVCPSPISYVTLRTLAVAVTAIPPAVAEAVAGPVWVGLGRFQIHTGIPTTPTPSDFGAMPMSAPLQTQILQRLLRERLDVADAPGRTGRGECRAAQPPPGRRAPSALPRSA